MILVVPGNQFRYKDTLALPLTLLTKNGLFANEKSCDIQSDDEEEEEEEEGLEENGELPVLSGSFF